MESNQHNQLLSTFDANNAKNISDIIFAENKKKLLPIINYDFWPSNSFAIMSENHLLNEEFVKFLTQKEPNIKAIILSKMNEVQVFDLINNAESNIIKLLVIIDKDRREIKLPDLYSRLENIMSVNIFNDYNTKSLDLLEKWFEQRNLKTSKANLKILIDALPSNYDSLIKITQFVENNIKMPRKLNKLAINEIVKIIR